jgi:hypothetical protein
VKPKLIRLELDFSIVKKIKQFEIILVEEAISDFYSSNNLTTNISHDDAKLSIEPDPPKKIEPEPPKNAENDDESPSKAEN